MPNALPFRIGWSVDDKDYRISESTRVDVPSLDAVVVKSFVRQAELLVKKRGLESSSRLKFLFERGRRRPGHEGLGS